MKDKFYYHLESLRGIAATIIVLHHLKSLSPNLAQSDFMQNSSLAVDFFFVLSGFVISLNYNNLLIKLDKVILFIKKRFFRLYPLHVILLFLYLIIEILKFLLEYKTGLKSNEQAFSVSNFSTLISNLFLLQGIIDKELSFNEVSWSISFEFYTYILFALMILFIKNKVILKIVISIIVITSLVSVYKLNLMDETNRLGYLRCLYSFFLGVLIYYLNVKLQNLNLSILEIPVVIISIYLYCYIPNTAFMPIIFGILIIILNQTKNGIIKSFLNNKVLIYVGKISYSIYMIHYLIIWTHIQFLRFLMGTKTEIINNYTYLKLNDLQSFLVIISVIFFVLIASSISYKYVENKFRIVKK